MPDLYSQIKKSPIIEYTSRDFDSLRKSLTKYLTLQYPDSFSDFSDQSAGMAILEAVCYAGDILNFYLDNQFSEIFLDTAKDENNVISLARNLGYKVRGKSASQNNNLILTFSYPTSGSTTDYEFVLRRGSRFSDKNGSSIHELLSDIDTSTVTSITRTVDVTNNVTSASISGIKVSAGITKTYSVNIGDPVQFLSIPIPDTDVLEILSVSSSDGYQWYEVDYLAQENQFIGTMNTTSTSASVPYVLTLRRVPRRFTVEKSTRGRVNLRFGSGILAQSDAEFIPNPEDFVLPPSVRGAVSGFSPAAVDPSDFINTGTLGTAPSNCSIVVKYRTGGGLNSNASARTITEILQRTIDYKTAGNSFQKSSLESSMKVTNPLPSTGGEEEETVDQIKFNASAFFASQLRCVTLQDYIVRCYTMPPEFGSVFRATAAKDTTDRLGVKLVVLSRNSDGTLTTCSDALKINIANYLKEFRSLSENLNIADGKIINVGLRFSVVTDPSANQQEILSNCLIKMKDYFDIRKWNMGQSISISLVQRALTDVNGVLAVADVSFTQMPGTYLGRTYTSSSSYYNLQGRTKSYVIQCDPDQIFEIKYPNFDIQGTILS